MKHIIIDTDLTNDIDDQFGISYALNNSDTFIEAIIISPYKNKLETKSIYDGVLDSYFEAKRICRFSRVNQNIVFKGCLDFLSNGFNKTSNGIKKIIDIARKNELTQIVCLSTLTNIALAIKKAPDIVDKIEIVWMGLENLYCEKFLDENYVNDKKAFEIIIKSQVKLNIIPKYVGKFNCTSIYEVQQHVANTPLGKYLLKILKDYKYNIENRGIKYIYSISPIAYVKNKNLFEQINLEKNLLIKENIKKVDGQFNYVFDGSNNCSVWKDFIKTISTAPTDLYKPKLFFISDTHFSQINKVRTKEFMIGPADQTDHEYIKNWNSVVGKNDIVYHLGDFGNYNIIKQLRGNVILICGNYEMQDIKNSNFETFKQNLINLGFKDVVLDGIVLDKKTLGIPIYLTHKPENTKSNMFNLFGHVHSLKPLKKNGFNVCAEYHNFTPLSEYFVKNYINFIISAQNDPNCFVD